LPLETVRTVKRPHADDLALGDVEATPARFPVGRDHADGKGTKALEPGDLAHDVLERGDPVSEPSGVLEALFACEPEQLLLQFRDRVVERLPVDALQGSRRELRTPATPDRPERPRRRRADHGVAAAA